ncbi:NAD(P)-dependent dehydrogenase (short-subunit alcohol dehydrogenase family) [Cytobacillus eiseniae]|uniref:NAD(P)-dependent dehydrogenase (Short-subunit alcohol dehydrogenase family) n=1 Tax=Cytobacillus eiseniae TaxID=762947 RepID=A0ABS4R9L2_9BACI|nr:(S)-benzoin forming benzil reductase [Cytobacillus eiseniae]MBP2239583.1 NAD(P)-dependent dehydrogenase (short-subunit alcohol dehydrogenase family) [Cytobacillus eiseniae]
MNVYIITGASKGIGFELAKQLSEEGHYVVGIARTDCELENVKFYRADISKSEKLESLLATILTAVQLDARSITLINNAGMVEPIGLIGTVDAKEMANAMVVNLTAPMILSNLFISKLKDFKGKKRIVNISSGAGRNPYEGWGTYCTTKAGLDHFSRVIALEQEKAEYPVRIVSIAPGIIDTGMQETIRASSEDAFPLLDRFIDYKEQGMLVSAEQTAMKLISFIENKDFNKIGPIADIRNF